MSTVLPDALLEEPPPGLLLLLPLLLQPAAARATAASAAAIAGVLLNTFMIFLSLDWLALRPGSTLTDPVWASWQCDSQGMNSLITRRPAIVPTRPTPGRVPQICRTLPDLPAPADSTTRTRESGVLGRWRISRPLSCVRSRPVDLSTYSTVTAEFAGDGDGDRHRRPR